MPEARIHTLRNRKWSSNTESINTWKAINRCIVYAFEYAKQNDRKKITLCAKTNVLTYAHDLWERIFYDVAENYPRIETDYGHVDAVCMWMVKNPEWFDVIVTDNMFGDIITDLGARFKEEWVLLLWKYKSRRCLNVWTYWRLCT